jgi:hypothetical protein
VPFKFFLHTLQNKRLHLLLRSEACLFPTDSDYHPCRDRFITPENSEDVINFSTSFSSLARHFFESFSSFQPSSLPALYVGVSSVFSLLSGHKKIEPSQGK